MATCKETTDEVDGRGNGNPSMDVTISEEYTLHDGNDSDGNVTDSSTDSETTPGRGIYAIVHFRNKVRKKLQEFKKPLYIPLTLEKYLKWQFITNNSSLLQQRMADLANITENVTATDGVLEVFLGRQKEDYDFDILTKTLEDTLLSDTDSVAVSWLPLKASHPGTEFLQVLNQVAQQSDIGNELYTEMTDTLNSKVIRCVHDINNSDKVNEITSQAVQEFEKKILSEWHSININVPIVYSQIFEKYDMKRRVRTVSSTVLVFFNIIESKDEFSVELRGQQKDLNRVREWIEEVFINPYFCLELGFDDVQMCEESIDIPSIIMNTLERKNFPDLFWAINKHSKKTWICSAKSDDAHDALQVVKQCVNQTKESKKTTKPVEEIESIVEELVSVHGDILGRSVSVRVLAEDDKDLAIYLTGDEHQLAHINNWFDIYTSRTIDMDTYAEDKQGDLEGYSCDEMRDETAATEPDHRILSHDKVTSTKLVAKQAENLIPAKDKMRTRSDLNQVAAQITDQSQASHPAPDTGESLISLPPKLPPKNTGIPEAGINIEIIIGQLNGFKADAIVNTTGKDLDLSKGNVSNALLKSAGDAMQKELYYRHPKGIEYWEIVQTGPYRFQGCKFALHGALEPYQNKSNKRLQKFVLDCLTEADRLQCVSIAFPAIGTGILGYPKQEVAQAMFEAVYKFEDRRQFLKEVKFVLYHLDKETIQAFQTAEKFHCKLVENRIMMEQELLYIRHIGTHIKYGRLEDITTTALIYIWEKMSSYSVRIKDHPLLKKTGKDVQQIWASHRDDPNYRELPLVTSGGDLPVSCITHVFCEDDKYHMKNALYEGLQMASGVDSVSVFFNDRCSFLRYGVIVVDIFVQCVNDVQKNETQLRNVLMVIEHRKLAEDFLAHFQKNQMVLRRRPPTQ